MPEDFFPGRAGGWNRDISKSPLWFCRKSLPVGLAEVHVGTDLLRWGWGVSGERYGYGLVVWPKGGEGGPCHFWEEIPAKKALIQPGGLTLGGEAGEQILVRNRELRTINRTIESFPSGRCPAIFCPGEPGRIWWTLKSPSTIWFQWSSRSVSKSGA